MEILSPETIESVNNLFQAIFATQYIMIAVAVFVLCEAIFATKLIDASLWKRTVSIAIGTILGGVFLPGGVLLGLLKGCVIGGLVTYLVARFGNK